MSTRATVGDRAKSLVPLKVGASEEFAVHDRTFQVKRVNHDTWHLRDTAVWQRSRFGTLAQIRKDVQHALDVGRLPPPAGERW